VATFGKLESKEDIYEILSSYQFLSEKTHQNQWILLGWSVLGIAQRKSCAHVNGQDRNAKTRGNFRSLGIETTTHENGQDRNGGFGPFSGCVARRYGGRQI
jgi:hypothetical protein